MCYSGGNRMISPFFQHMAQDQTKELLINAILILFTDLRNNAQCFQYFNDIFHENTRTFFNEVHHFFNSRH